jgi:hypothetical protein
MVPLACSLASLETASIECIVEAVALIENTLIRGGVENACSLASLETASIECIMGTAASGVFSIENTLIRGGVENTLMLRAAA